MNKDILASVVNLLATTCPSIRELGLRAGEYTQAEILVFQLGPLKVFMLGKGRYFRGLVWELVTKSRGTLEVLKFERKVQIACIDVEH
ncbi:hypothetical protein BGZ52_012937, partial [Haplosporangium bisporale]